MICGQFQDGQLVRIDAYVTRPQQLATNLPRLHPQGLSQHYV